jgi:hypothetical protein
MIGIIYELICNETGERYVGSTTNFGQRKRLHKCLSTNSCVSKQIIMRGKYKYNILENYEYSDKSELRQREDDYIKLLDCINPRGSYLSIDEKRQRKKGYDKTYFEKHSDKIKKRREEAYRNSDRFKDRKNKPKQTEEEFKEWYNKWNTRINCECGGQTTKKHRNVHLKSIRHTEFEKTKVTEDKA